MYNIRLSVWPHRHKIVPKSSESWHRSQGQSQCISVIASIFWRWNQRFKSFTTVSLKSYGYGSIPINTIFSGMNIHKSQLFWCELQGYKVLTHPHIARPMARHAPESAAAMASKSCRKTWALGPIPNPPRNGITNEPLSNYELKITLIFWLKHREKGKK